MCVAPLNLADGTETACHECWQCRENAINDWVGRNIAESRTAVASHAVTLTYGRSKRSGEVDHERAVILTYSDVQKYLKLLRRHGYAVRYFVTGEFGSLKGRAHWHIMLYWLDKVPPHELDRNFMEDHWPHGWSFWTEPTPHAVRYNCKYIQKDMGDAERQGHLAMSKKPPLGARYFESLAERYVAQELAPQDLSYRFRFPNADGTWKVHEFMLRDRSAELFLAHYVRAWELARPGRPTPPSELVNNWVEWGVPRVPEGAAQYAAFVERRPSTGLVVPRSKYADETPEEEAERVTRERRRTEQRDALRDAAWDDFMEMKANGEKQQQTNDEFIAERQRVVDEFVRGRGRAPGHDWKEGDHAKGGR